MKLYHGTSEGSAKKALEEGIKPRAITRKEGNWSHFISSNPAHVYLTVAYAPYFALCSTRKEENLAVLEVDTDLLQEDCLRPDEDFLEQATRGNPNMLPHLPMKDRTMWFRKHLKDFASHWKDSLKGLGTCSHKGVVPPQAITRASAFSLEGWKLNLCIDPSICLVNFRVCGDRYKAFTKWAIGDPVTVEEILSWELHHLPQDIVSERRKELDDRRGWVKLK